MLDFEELDHYQLLGISRAASADEIKRAYRREIAKYHPDRYANAGPDEREYAALRAQRVNEAYRVLSDFRARSDYNRGAQPRVQRPTPPPAQHRDYQAELYDQAREHLAAGRPLQAVASLRQLQKLNPLYRDSADLLAHAQSLLDQRPNPANGPARRLPPRRVLLAGGIGGAMAATALLAWAFGRAPQSPNQTSGSAWTSAPVVVATDLPATPVPRAIVPTEAPTATTLPTVPATLTALPTEIPTDPPTPTIETVRVAPSATPGRLLLDEQFDVQRWAEQQGRGWSVGYVGDRYQIIAEPNVGAIWSYRSGPSGAASYTVDMQTSGEGGLLLRFLDESNYLTCTFDSGLGIYKVSQQIGGVDTILAEGSNQAIQRGATATNRMETRVQGDRLLLFANGQSLTDIVIQNLSDSPRYGLVVYANNTTTEAYFDNLQIRALEP